MAAIHRVVKLSGGGKLITYEGGKRVYAPSQAYKERRQEYTRARVFRSKPDTTENCFKLLSAIHKLLVDHKRCPKASVNNGTNRCASTSI